MKEAQIVEIFKSIQGEGAYAGVNQVFVRFYRCNMHCSWCDTPHSIGDKNQSYTSINIEDLEKRINELGNDIHSISLTGGEPLMQAEFIEELISLASFSSHSFHLETNGTLPEELKKVIDLIDVVAMDIKLPSSTNCKAYWDEHQEFIKIAKQKELFIKTVVSLNTIKEDIEKCIEVLMATAPETLLIIQPNTYEMKEGVVKICLEYFELANQELENVRLLPQMHKFLRIA